MPKIETRGNLPSTDRRSQSFHQIRSEPTSRWNTSLRWDSPSTRYSTLSNVNRGLGTRDPSSTISHFPKQKNIALIMTVRNTRPSSAGPSRSRWKNSSNKVSSKSTSSLPKSLQIRTAKHYAYPAKHLITQYKIIEWLHISKRQGSTPILSTSCIPISCIPF